MSGNLSRPRRESNRRPGENRSGSLFGSRTGPRPWNWPGRPLENLTTDIEVNIASRVIEDLLNRVLSETEIALSSGGSGGVVRFQPQLGIPEKYFPVPSFSFDYLGVQVARGSLVDLRTSDITVELNDGDPTFPNGSITVVIGFESQGNEIVVDTFGTLFRTNVVSVDTTGLAITLTMGLELRGGELTYDPDTVVPEVHLERFDVEPFVDELEDPLRRWFFHDIVEKRLEQAMQDALRAEPVRQSISLGLTLQHDFVPPTMRLNAVDIDGGKMRLGIAA